MDRAIENSMTNVLLRTCPACQGTWFREATLYEFGRGPYGAEPEQVSHMPMTVLICLCGTPLRPLVGGVRGGRTPNRELLQFRGNLERAERYRESRHNLSRHQQQAARRFATREGLLQVRITAADVERQIGRVLASEHNVRKGFFEHDQFLALRTALPEYLRPVLTFAYYTGCRRGEILTLRWTQVDLLERVVRLEPGTTKNAEARNLPLTTELYQILAMQKAIRDTKFPMCPWVFFSETGNRVGRFQRSWRTACKAAGLATEVGEPDPLFHDLRRSGVRSLIRAGVPESVAMRISGHKTRSVFERYNIVSERDLHEAARKLETYVAGKTNPTQPGHILGTPKSNSADLSGSRAAKLLN